MVLMRRARIGLLLLFLSVAFPPAASAILVEDHDLASLALEAKGVVLAERLGERPAEKWGTTIRFRVKKAYKGPPAYAVASIGSLATGRLWDVELTCGLVDAERLVLPGRWAFSVLDASGGPVREGSLPVDVEDRSIPGEELARDPALRRAAEDHHPTWPFWSAGSVWGCTRLLYLADPLPPGRYRMVFRTELRGAGEVETPPVEIEVPAGATTAPGRSRSFRAGGRPSRRRCGRRRPCWR